MARMSKSKLCLLPLILACFGCSHAAGVEEEAMRIAQQFYASHWKQCGDVWVAREGGFDMPRYIEIREPQILQRTTEVSDISRMNGYEYSGTLTLAGKYIRETSGGKSNNNKWLDWRSLYDGKGFNDNSPDIDVELEKRNGKWGEINTHGRGLPSADFACSDLPRD